MLIENDTLHFHVSVYIPGERLLLTADQLSYLLATYSYCPVILLLVQCFKALRNLKNMSKTN